jgi:DNA-binding MarR family transcriptional regulator
MDKRREYIRRIMVASSCIQGTYEKWAKDSNMKHNTLTLLYALNDGKSHTQKSICEEWMIPKTTLNTIIKDCEKEGYIRLEHVEGKKRELEIHMTRKGAEYEKNSTIAVCAAEEKAMEKVLEKCSPEFIDQMEYFARCLREELEEIQEKKNEY